IHLAIGVFDGVHLGHRALIAELRRGAKPDGVAVAVTFDPLPIQVLAPGAPASALSDVKERVRLLRDAGADAVVVFHFDDAFAKLSADEFVDRIRSACDIRRIVVGPDFHFGHRAEGDVEKLRVREAFLLDFSGEVYGEEVEAAFVKRLRDEIAFASPAELSAQIAKDVEETRRALA